MTLCHMYDSSASVCVAASSTCTTKRATLGSGDSASLMHCTADNQFVAAVAGEETRFQAEAVPANLSKRVQSVDRIQGQRRSAHTDSCSVKYADDGNIQAQQQHIRGRTIRAAQTDCITLVQGRLVVVSARIHVRATWQESSNTHDH